MHYSAYSGGKLVIDAGEYTDIIGQRYAASEGDILQLELLYHCQSGPRYLGARNAWPCTTDCRCQAGQKGCKGYDASCRGSLVCEDDVCKVAGTSIESVARAYESGDSVTLSFNNPGRDRVWIAIYSSNEDPHNIKSSAEAWSWPCGSTTCSEQSLSSGSIELTGVSDGELRAVLMIDMFWPYESVAYSSTFSVGGSFVEPNLSSTPESTLPPTPVPTTLPSSLSTPHQTPSPTNPLWTSRPWWWWCM